MSSIGRTACVVGMSLLATSCGRKGALIYPDMLVPAAPASVTAQQSGSAVKLRFILPDKDRAGRPVQGVAGVKISRRVTEADRKDACRSCMTDYLPFRTLYLDHLPTDTQRSGSRLILLDSDVRAGNIYSYSIVPFTVERLDGAASIVADVRVGAPFAAPSLELTAFPTEVKLHFSRQSLLAGQFTGYNIYRSAVATGRPYQPLNKEPLNVSEYTDSALERGVSYRYWARAVIRQVSGEVVESMESEEVQGRLKDDE